MNAAGGAYAAIAVLTAVALTRVVQARRPHPRWWRWRTAVITITVWAIVTLIVAASVSAQPTSPTASTFVVLAPTAGAALLLLAAQWWPTTIEVSSLSSLARITASAVRHQQHTAGYPVDYDAAATIIRTARMGVVSLTGGHPATDTSPGTVPTLIGYLSVDDANTLAEAAASVAARLVIVDPDEPNGHATVSSIGIDTEECYPPDVSHLWFPHGVTASETLCAATAAATLVAVFFDVKCADEAHLTWRKLAAAMSEGVLR